MKANSIINVPSNAADNSLPPPSMTAADSIGPAELTRIAPQVLKKIDALTMTNLYYETLQKMAKNVACLLPHGLMIANEIK